MCTQSNFWLIHSSGSDDILTNAKMHKKENGTRNWLFNQFRVWVLFYFVSFKLGEDLLNCVSVSKLF